MGLGIGCLFVTQLFDAAMLVNAYRFQEYFLTSIKLVNKNENQSQKGSESRGSFRRS